MEKEIALPDNRVLKIVQDESPESPREWDNLGTIACFHRRYNLGDEDIPFDTDDFEGWAEMKDHIQNKLGAKVVLPLYLYDHSGVTISTTPFSCRWDSGQIGFIYVTEEKLREEYDEVTDEVIEKAQKILEGEVETYDQYLTGDVYGFKLIKKSTCDHHHEHEELLDSCYGFYGSDITTNGILDHLSEEDRKAIDSL